MLASKSGRPDVAEDLDLPDETDEVAEPAEEVTEEQQGFRDRAAREDERFRLATDSEYWLMFCFRKPDDPARFARALGMEPGRLVSGPALAAAIGDRPPLTAAQRTKQMLMARSTRGVDTTAQLARSHCRTPSRVSNRPATSPQTPAVTSPRSSPRSKPHPTRTPSMCSTRRTGCAPTGPAETPRTSSSPLAVWKSSATNTSTATRP
jgi:hypothetical protein